MTRRNGKTLASAAVLWVGLLAIILVLTGRTSEPAEAYQPLRITSVSPNPALAADTVTLQLDGLGTGKAVVWMGGSFVPITSRTTSSLSFVVPPSTTPGDKLVVVWAPLLKIAWTRLTVVEPPPPFDGGVTPQLDVAQSVTERVGPQGGSLNATGATLTIPPGALLDEQDITMTPLLGIDGLPAQSLFDAVQFEPTGLRFLLPATLSLPRPAGVSTADLATFLYEGDGQETHLAPYTLTLSTIAVSISHFSGAGSASGAGGFSSFTPNGAQALAEQQIALANQQFANGAITEAFRDTIYDNALRNWYQTVFNDFQAANAASGAPIENFVAATAGWNSWRAQVEILQRQVALASELSAGRTIAGLIAASHAHRALDGCTGAGPDPFSGVQSVVKLVAILATDPQTFDLAAIDATLANGNDLIEKCASIQIDPIDVPAVFARFSDRNTVETGIRVNFANGPSRTDIPFVVEIDEVTQNGTFSRSLVTVTTGQLSTRVDIEEPGGSTRLDATVHLLAEASNPALSFFKTNRFVDRPVRLRTELEYQDPGTGTFTQDLTTVDEGGVIQFSALLAGDGMEGQSVQFAVSSGDGSVQPLSGVTTAQGAAAFAFNAPTGSTNPRSCVAAIWSYSGDAESAEDCFDIQNGTPTPTPTTIVLPTSTPTPNDPSGTYEPLTTHICDPIDGCTANGVPGSVLILPTDVAGFTHQIIIGGLAPLLCSSQITVFWATITNGAIAARGAACGSMGKPGDPGYVLGDSVIPGTVTASSVSIDFFSAGPSSYSISAPRAP